MIRFLAHFLFLLAAWTLTTKYLLAVNWVLIEGAPLASYAYSELWWIAHLWLGRALLARPRYLLEMSFRLPTTSIALTRFAGVELAAFSPTLRVLKIRSAQKSAIDHTTGRRSILAAQYLNSGILPIGSSAELVSTLAAASA